jgi:hypothetical protein
MKAALVVLVAVFVALGCSVSHKSQDFACTKQTDCSGHPNTTCNNGFCIANGSIDAPKPPGDAHPDTPANTCPAECTSCNTTQKTCTIDCSQTSIVDCNAQVSCPAGYHCDILCNRDGMCRNGVSCVGGLSCQVSCSTTNTCENIVCGDGPCDVTCSGQQSCKGVSCNTSCACDVNCTGLGACESVTCPSPLCDTGLGCTSVPAGCHSCM